MRDWTSSDKPHSTISVCPSLGEALFGSTEGLSTSQLLKALLHALLERSQCALYQHPYGVRLTAELWSDLPMRQWRRISIEVELAPPSRKTLELAATKAFLSSTDTVSSVGSLQASLTNLVWGGD